MTIRRLIRTISHAGESYLARTPAEYFRTLAKASGAGLVTVCTVVLKYAIGVLKISLSGEALLSCLNYAGSFLLMQGLGFRLATKQPSLLAATLLKRLGPGGSVFRGHFVAVTRSQFAATIGNFLAVVPSSVVFQMVFESATGSAFLTPEKAAQTIASLHPFATGTLLYAALTGVLLWVSSLASGWFGLLGRATRIARVGRDPTWLYRRVGRRLTFHAAGIGFNLTLACALAIVPLLGKSLGVPFDVRHFTLSSGALAVSTYTLGPAAAWKAGWGFAIAGIGAIGALNFIVSFALSFVSGMVVRRIGVAELKVLASGTLRSFARDPLRYLFPMGICALPRAARRDDGSDGVPVGALLEERGLPGMKLGVLVLEELKASQGRR